MKLEVSACDLGLSGGRFGACAVDTDSEVGWRAALSAPQRTARAVAGVGLLALSASLAGRKAAWPAAGVAAWFGASHLVAGATAFHGCPELGAIPTLLARRPVATECGPWEWLDQRLHLVPEQP